LRRIADDLDEEMELHRALTEQRLEREGLPPEEVRRRSPIDPAAYIGVVVLLAVSATFATYIPARRATRIDPVVALRAE
jgi:hypothetical protein